MLGEDDRRNKHGQFKDIQRPIIAIIIMKC